MAALTPLVPTATSETSSPKDRPTTKHPIISPEEAADPLKPLTLLVGSSPAGCRSDGWDAPAVQHIVGAADEGGAAGRQECDQLGDLLRPAGPADRDAAHNIH